MSAGDNEQDLFFWLSNKTYQKLTALFSQRRARTNDDESFEHRDFKKLYLRL